MAKKMLIDAAHPEETRVVVVSGNRVEEFDFESAAKKQLKGNIYLAKVTRVEPSLQAAFVDYGGNRHGFLAFSEIHPDYYQIPVEDRLALLQEEAEEEEDDEADDERGREDDARDEHDETEAGEEEDEPEADFAAESEDDAEHGGDEDTHGHPADHLTAAETSPVATSQEPLKYGAVGPEVEQDEALPEGILNPAADHEAEEELRHEAARAHDQGLDAPEISTEAESATEAEGDAPESVEAQASEENEAETAEAPQTETPPEEVGAQDAMEELPRRRRRQARRYKIQEVIKRRQIILVQVVKEERGNKGAALTTYLSLAGRYCVLMPNTDRGGGISRKITSGSDRKRLKDIAEELEVPEGMGLIIRTAGANRTRAELKRDFEYLLRLWENVRELTLSSSAPALVYEEGNLVKRSIRDLYGRDIDSVQVEGDEAYKEAKAFMKMLTPSHAKNVQQYRDKLPLFQRYQVETQLDSLYSPRVELKSGGYLVMNSTEALVAIDVNSGKSTREHSIEETALRTNLEAAEEVARQLRLRDLAGLIVIDFIDMEEHRHDRQVERKLKECLKTDRARIQVGRISAFGLLEMSRQRLRASVLEGSTLVCEQCDGAGRVPSTESTALRILRAIEEEGIRGRMDAARVRAPTEVAYYILNHKRSALTEIEERFGLPCFIEPDAELHAGRFEIEKAPAGLIDWRPAQPVVSPESGFMAETEAEEEIDVDEEPVEEAEEEDRREIRVREDDDGRRRRRRRRPRRSEEREARSNQSEASDAGEAEHEAAEGDEAETEGEPQAAHSGDGDEKSRRRRRRGRRGGRRNRRRESESGQEEQAQLAEATAEGETEPDAAIVDAEATIELEERLEAEPGDEAGEAILIASQEAAGAEAAPEPEQPREVEAEPVATEEPSSDIPQPDEQPEPKATQWQPEGNGGETAEPEPAPPHPQDEDEDQDDSDEPPRRGWWQRRIFG